MMWKNLGKFRTKWAMHLRLGSLKMTSMKYMHPIEEAQGTRVYTIYRHDGLVKFICVTDKSSLPSKENTCEATP